MAQLGYSLLLVAMIITVLTAAFAVVGHHRHEARMVKASAYGVYSVCGLLTVSSMAMIFLFLTNDYSVKYVEHYSDRSMPLFYKATAFWGGQDGSLLFWAWTMALWMALGIYLYRHKLRELLPYTIVSLMTVTFFFLILLVFVANPFETHLGPAPTDGRGLNPLLQNPYMVIHPPTLYLGYVGWTVPFCFAIGALAHNRLDLPWIGALRRFSLFAWSFLGLGLVLGGVWAYEELGWGGYWAWDPVENAALVPWLTGTAFLHSIQVQERRGIFKFWSLLLIISTFVLTLLGTMMTRSGIVQSVHAFGESPIGSYFLWFLILVCTASVFLLILRSRELVPKETIESLLSREFAFLITNWLFALASVFVVVATLFPTFMKYVKNQEVAVGPPFFNEWMTPFGLTLLFFTGVCPLLSWRRSSSTTMLAQFRLPVIAALLTLLLCLFGLSISAIKPLVTFTLCAFAGTAVLQEVYRGAGRRAGFLSSAHTRRRYGGYTVHFGVVLVFLGFAGDSFQKAEELNLKRGETTVVGPYGVRLDGLSFMDDGQKNRVTAHLTVSSKSDGQILGTLEPARWAYRKPEGANSSEVDKKMTLADDLYVVLGAFDADAGFAALQLKVNPLVNFVWIGWGLLFLGFCICVWPDEQRSRERAVVHRAVPIAATMLVVMILFLGWIW